MLGACRRGRRRSGSLLSACSMGGMFGRRAPSASTPAVAERHRDPRRRSRPRARRCRPSPPNARRSRCGPAPRRSTSTARARSAIPSDLQYQAVIDKQSRNCVVSNGLITVKMGVVGRLMLGPAGNQTSVDLPLRFAVERDDGAAVLRALQDPGDASRRRRRPAISSRSSTNVADPLCGGRRHHHLGRLRQLRQEVLITSPRRIDSGAADLII